MSEETYRLGPFRLDGRLGEGGMAEVWLGTHRDFGGRAAVKVMASSLGGSRRQREQFFAEARAHAGLDHPHIVRLLDFGYVDDSDRPPPGAEVGHPYLVMEVADGTLVETPVRSYGDLLHVVIEVLDALAYSHARGVVHRDLKPANVLVTGSGSERHYKLADFGVAHSLKLDETADDDDLSLTIGTPMFMAPEQFRGRWFDYGPWTDIYALGCLAYALVAGRPPFVASGFYALAQKHLREPAPPLEPRFDVPSEFGLWLARTLEKDPRDRFRWAAAAAESLARVSSGFVPARPPGEPADEIEDAPTEPVDFVYDMTTLVDPFDFATAETSDAGHVPLGDLARSTAAGSPMRLEPIDVPVVEMPPTWRDARPPPEEPVLEGLGLFALREDPIVGQRAVRDRLWQLLTDVVGTGELRVCSLRGSERAPLSELATWLGTRAPELGIARLQRAYHSEAGGPREGLVGLCEDLLGTWGLHGDALKRRVREAIEDRLPERLERSVIAIMESELTRARGGTQRRVVPTRVERYRAVAHLLDALCLDRALILWVENAGWSADSVGFVDYLLEHSTGTPMLVITTWSAGATGDRTLALRELRDVETSDRTTTLDVPDYERRELREMVTRLLPLSDGAARSVLGVSGDDRKVLRVLLTHLVKRNRLAPARDGFDIRGELPEGPREIFARRIRAAAGRDESLQRALEVAAVLGRSPDPDEIDAVCAELGLAVEHDLEAVTVEHGLARRAGNRWAFVHGGIPDVLTDMASEARRLRTIHAACARVLAARTSRDKGREWRRVAEHYIEAGEPREALEPLYVAARELQRSDLPAARSLLELRRSVLDTVGADDDDPAAVDQLNAVALVRRTEGDLEGGREAAQRAEKRARASGYRRGLGDALRQLARFAIDAGNLDDASRMLAESGEVFRELGDPLYEALTLFNAGYVDYRRADLESAERCYRRAIELYEAEEAFQQQATVMSYLSALLTARDELDAATQWAEEAMQLARDVGALAVVAEVMSDLAEIRRFSGDYEAARELYAETKNWATLGGVRTVQVAELNLALCDVADGRWDDARTSLTTIRETYRVAGIHSRDQVLSAAIGICRLAAGDVDGFEREVGELPSESPADRDLPWLWELGAAVARQKGESDIARRLTAAAARQYAALGLGERAESVSGP